MSSPDPPPAEVIAAGEGEMGEGAEAAAGRTIGLVNASTGPSLSRL
jgi:hypothetical protein